MIVFRFAVTQIAKFISDLLPVCEQPADGTIDPEHRDEPLVTVEEVPVCLDLLHGWKDAMEYIFCLGAAAHAMDVVLHSIM